MSSKRWHWVTLFLLISFSFGCVQPSLYRWGDYEDRLHDYYENPDTQTAYLYAVRKIVEDSEERSLKPPPGLCLEYAIALYQAGYSADAVVYLEKESSYWPESAVLVGAMVKRMDEMERPAPPAIVDETTMYWLPGLEKPGASQKSGSKGRRRRR